MKKRLESLYLENLDQIKSVRLKYNDYDLKGPFLISPSQKYNIAKNKLFIIGQQTNGWCCDINSVQNQMKCYDDFNLGEMDSSTAFWNVFHKIEKTILNDNYCSAWGNFNRYEFEADRPTGEIENEIAKLDYLLKDEIKVLKPDICLFLIGHSFDDRIKQLFPNAVFDKVGDWNINQLAKIKHADLPIYSYRTYHPKHLRRGSLEEPFINELKKEIK